MFIDISQIWIKRSAFLMQTPFSRFVRVWRTACGHFTHFTGKEAVKQRTYESNSLENRFVPHVNFVQTVQRLCVQNWEYGRYLNLYIVACQAHPVLHEKIYIGIFSLSPVLWEQTAQMCMNRCWCNQSKLTCGTNWIFSLYQRMDRIFFHVRNGGTIFYHSQKWGPENLATACRKFFMKDFKEILVREILGAPPGGPPPKGGAPR